MNTNLNYQNLNESYLFSTISKKVNAYKAANPEAEVIRLGIGDVTLPLVPVVIDALHAAVTEMSDKATFKGYGEEQGYEFLRNAVSDYYKESSVCLANDEIFISDGSKSDIGNILDIFATDNTVLIPNPVYPVYVDTNVMAGRKIIFAEGNAENDFLPMPNFEEKADIIYMCSPNNPTGSVYTKEQLAVWVDYALKNEAVILFDSAYEVFVKDESLPRSIYQVEGATKCAIEFCSLSKTAGFTGTRLGYTVVPKDLMMGEVSLNKLWLRRQTTKFNGVPYIIQRGAAAVFTEEGKAQFRANIDYYLGNAKVITEKLTELGIWFTGGINSPYIWLKCPGDMNSWDFFDLLLNEYNIVGTPGSGFGSAGEGYFRLTAFGNREDVEKAMDRLTGFKL